MMIKLLVGICMIFVIPAQGCAQEKVNTLTVFQKGAPFKIEDQKSKSSFIDILSVSLQNMDNVLRMILTPEQIEEMQNQEDGVEVIFEKEQTARRKNNKHPVNFTKVYIPLSGKLEKFGTVFIFGDGDGYGSLPPYVNSGNKVLSELKHWIKIRSSDEK